MKTGECCQTCGNHGKGAEQTETKSSTFGIRYENIVDQCEQARDVFSLLVCLLTILLKNCG